MRLYFEDSYGKRRLIGGPKTSDESFKMISDFCKERNFEIYYVRSWVTPNGEKHYDVGSHSEFFIEVGDNNGDARDN